MWARSNLHELSVLPLVLYGPLNRTNRRGHRPKPLALRLAHDKLEPPFPCSRRVGWGAGDLAAAEASPTPQGLRS